MDFRPQTPSLLTPPLSIIHEMLDQEKPLACFSGNDELFRSPDFENLGVACTRGRSLKYHLQSKTIVMCGC